MKYLIWKYEIKTTDEQYIEVPYGSEFLCVQVQYGAPCIWVKFPSETRDDLIKRKVVVVGTGNPFLNIHNLTYLGTYQLDNGIFIGHVFVDMIKD